MKVTRTLAVTTEASPLKPFPAPDTKPPAYTNPLVAQSYICNGMLVEQADNYLRSVEDLPAINPFSIGRRDASKPAYLDTFFADATYEGHQTGTDHEGLQQKYRVDVCIHSVSLASHSAAGYLSIYNLTPQYPVLTTYFDAELINGGKHAFLTDRWSAEKAIDMRHWSRFPHFARHLMQTFEDDSYMTYDYASPENSMLYMRWKEHFLVHDCRQRQLEGASYDGFYYVCLDKHAGTIDGYYYHQTSAEFQQLKLTLTYPRPVQAWAPR